MVFSVNLSFFATWQAVNGLSPVIMVTYYNKSTMINYVTINLFVYCQNTFIMYKLTFRFLDAINLFKYAKIFLIVVRLSVTWYYLINMFKSVSQDKNQIQFFNTGFQKEFFTNSQNHTLKCLIVCTLYFYILIFQYLSTVHSEIIEIFLSLWKRQ